MFLKRNVGVLKKDQVRRYIDLQHSSPPSSRHDRESVRLGLALGRLLHPNFVAPGRDLPIWKNSFFNVDFDSFNWHGFSLALSIAPLRVELYFFLSVLMRELKTKCIKSVTCAEPYFAFYVGCVSANHSSRRLQLPTTLYL